MAKNNISYFTVQTLHIIQTNIMGREGWEINTCETRFPSQAGQAEHLGPCFHLPSLVLAGRGSTWLQQHSHDWHSSRLRTEVINGKSNIAAMEENSSYSRWGAEELASNRCTALPLLTWVAALAQLD